MKMKMKRKMKRKRKISYFILSTKERLQAHRHVLTNCREVDPFLREYRDILRRQFRNNIRSSSELDKKVHREFVEWFSRRMGKGIYHWQGFLEMMRLSNKSNTPPLGTRGSSLSQSQATLNTVKQNSSALSFLSLACIVHRITVLFFITISKYSVSEQGQRMKLKEYVNMQSPWRGLEIVGRGMESKW
ncbi:hypothetical protein RJT34_24997 [Clitoria ternatea]|uniref:Uncharacterized protein n=1 Tax=Clitoria ternatea TaxID=43366 RepID=A0AAN9FRQ8_CLITE